MSKQYIVKTAKFGGTVVPPCPTLDPPVVRDPVVSGMWVLLLYISFIIKYEWERVSGMWDPLLKMEKWKVTNF